MDGMNVDARADYVAAMEAREAQARPDEGVAVLVEGPDHETEEFTRCVSVNVNGEVIQTTHAQDMDLARMLAFDWAVKRGLTEFKLVRSAEADLAP